MLSVRVCVCVFRVQELSAGRDKNRDSPEGYVPSSSPECEADMEISRYPDLSHVKLEPPSPCASPTIPIMPCAWGKGESSDRDLLDWGRGCVCLLLNVSVIVCVCPGTAIKQEIKAEPSQLGPPSCSNTGLVSIGITLNSIAAQVTTDLTAIRVYIQHTRLRRTNGDYLFIFYFEVQLKRKTRFQITVVKVKLI